MEIIQKKCRSNVQYETSIHFRINKREYMKVKINELEKTGRTRISGVCVEVDINIRMITNL
jgi:hypothetical protein